MYTKYKIAIQPEGLFAMTYTPKCDVQSFVLGYSPQPSFLKP